MKDRFIQVYNERKDCFNLIDRLKGETVDTNKEPYNGVRIIKAQGYVIPGDEVVWTYK